MNFVERSLYGPDRFRAQAQATRALLKFCADHNRAHPAEENLAQCLRALEVGEISNALNAFCSIPLGKECFNDWWPPVVYPNENPEYVEAVFNALVERWVRLMNSAAEEE